jgi:dynein heavy chain, axonemal
VVWLVVQVLDKLADKNVVTFDTLLASYELLADTVRSQPPEKEIEFLWIDCAAVGHGIAAQAEQWKLDYGDVLAHASRAKLEKVLGRIAQWQEDLGHDTKDLVELKFVLQTVATICENSMDMELEYVDVVERYQTLVRYKVRHRRA